MNYGLYTAYLGMRARQRTLEAIASNIANASTSGFKSEQVYYHSVEAAELESQQKAAAAMQEVRAREISEIAHDPFSAAGIASDLRRSYGVVTGSAADYTQGAIRETGRSLDIALEGDGFLVIQTPRGERYTRAGALTIDAGGQLVTQRGELVVGEGGPITLPPGNISIGEDGTIASNGQTAGQLRVVRFNDPRSALIKEGDNLFVLKNSAEKTSPQNNPAQNNSNGSNAEAQPIPATNVRVVQGALELANVNPVSEMAAMIQNSREFDSLQRSITLMMNDVGRKVAGEIGRL